MNLVGTTLGKYQIIEELGRGGMAIVYKAYEARLSRQVALKILPPEFTFDPEFVRRFQQEARTAGGLAHPHIVPIYDVGDENGINYIAMMYVEGQSLYRLIASGRLPSQEWVINIVNQIASALDYAHQRKIIHRDIKPSNILVDAQGQAFLTDFGIARAVEGTRITKTGMLMGTPEYMSPEQAQGQTLDWRTDIYSLGVVVYEMLTGQVPFSGTTTKVLHDQVYTPLPALRALNPAVPAAVEAIVAQALAKNPADRPQRAGEFAQKLAAAVRGEPMRVSTPAKGIPQRVATPPPVAPDRGRSRAALLLLPLALGGVALVVVVALVAVLASGVLPGPAPTPSPSPTPTAAATAAIPAATLRPTFTPSPPASTPSPVTAASPTATRLPSPTPSPPTPTPRPTPINTPVISQPGIVYNPPVLRGPADRATFTGRDIPIILTWEPIRTLGVNDYYVVKIPHMQGEDWQWTKATQLQVPGYLFYLGFANREYRWTVTIYRYTGPQLSQGQNPQGQDQGIAVSEESAPRTFIWKAPGNGAAPTPTKES